MDFELDMNVIGNKVLEVLIDYGPKVLLALITLVVGLKVINSLVKLLLKGLSKSSKDETLQRFVGNLMTWVLKIMLFISVASMIGIQTTSFVAVLGAAGLAIGLALQGTLANFAGGVLIILFKPFRVGDLVNVQGEIGIVKNIEIFTTQILSPTNKRIIIPNGTLANSNIINLSAEGKLRVDLTIGVGYDENIKQTKDVLMHSYMNVEALKKTIETKEAHYFSRSRKNIWHKKFYKY